MPIIRDRICRSTLSHWRDNNGHEVDSLLRFRDKVDTTKVGVPTFTGVITTRSPAYRRPDGVLVIPVAQNRKVGN